jgi:hypothetical protein
LRALVNTVVGNWPVPALMRLDGSADDEAVSMRRGAERPVGADTTL